MRGYRDVGQDHVPTDEIWDRRATHVRMLCVPQYHGSNRRELRPPRLAASFIRRDHPREHRFESAARILLHCSMDSAWWPSRLEPHAGAILVPSVCCVFAGGATVVLRPPQLAACCLSGGRPSNSRGISRRLSLRGACWRTPRDRRRRAPQTIRRVRHRRHREHT